MNNIKKCKEIKKKEKVFFWNNIEQLTKYKNIFLNFLFSI